jgi:hypothetical protein
VKLTNPKGQIMNKTKASKYDLNSEPLKSMLGRVIKDVKGFAKLNIKEQVAINKFPPFSGKHQLEFTKQTVDLYKKDPFAITVEFMTATLLCPLPFGRETTKEKNKRLKLEAKFNIQKEPLKSFFNFIISDIESFIMDIMKKRKPKGDEHPASYLLEIIDSYKKDITFKN